MDEISPTRMNLLVRKAQLQLAVQGIELLKNKRDALIGEFMKLIDRMMDRRQTLEDVTHNSYHALAFCRAFDGEEVLRSAALAARRSLSVEIRRKKIWGLNMPEIERVHADRSVIERGYSFAGVPGRVDVTARGFEEIINALIDIASTDVIIRRLGEEIKRTNRRVNALEQVLVPRLRSEARFISSTLEEREREDTYRLKKVKGGSRSGGRNARRGSRGAARTRPGRRQGVSCPPARLEPGPADPRCGRASG